MVNKILRRLRGLLWCFWINGEPGRRRGPQRINELLAQHTLTIQSPSLRAGRWPFPLRVLVSTVANSKFQNARDCPRARLHFSIQLSGKVRPAERGDPVGPRLHVERENAADAGTRGDRVRKPSHSFRRPSPFLRTLSAT